MSWVAFDRAVRYHDEFGREGPFERWRALRDEIHAEVVARSWCDEKQAFAQSYDSDRLDAAVLLMPLVGFLPADDPRVVSTVAAIRRELSVDGLLLRYLPEEGGAVDGLPPGEGVFLPCSFWLVAVLALQGEHDAGARALRAAARPPQRRRPARRGVRPGLAGASSATSRRRSRTSRWSGRPWPSRRAGASASPVVGSALTADQQPAGRLLRTSRGYRARRLRCRPVTLSRRFLMRRALTRARLLAVAARESPAISVAGVMSASAADNASRSSRS